MAWLFGFTLFLSGLLFFTAQPMIAKMVLPILGGTPGVWNTCMVFYQAMLLAGYLYAHAGARRFRLAVQVMLQALLLIAAAPSLPFLLSVDAQPPKAGEMTPAFWLFSLLTSTAGLPLMVLATTAPLLQHWFSMSGHRDASDPYFLYAASNTGSLGGLLCYPWFVEAWLSLNQQNQLWRMGFVVYASAVACSGVAAIGYSRSESTPETATANDHQSFPRIRDLAWWMALAFVPSSWLLSLTTYITTDLAAIPLLWTIPLGLYLLSFIVGFTRGFENWTQPVSAAFCLAVVPLVLVLSAGFVQLFWIPLHLLAFFLGSLGCHGRLAAARPVSKSLTAFYLAIATGGVLGGVFNALLAPVILDGLAEYPLAIVLACLLIPAVKPRQIRSHAADRSLDVILPLIVLGLMVMLEARPYQALNSIPGMVAITAVSGIGLYACVSGLRRPLRFTLTVAAVLMASSLARRPGGVVIHQERNFYGILKVLNDRETNVHRFMHGNTLHGQQSLDPTLRREPSTYFTRSGPIGDVFTVFETSSSRRNTHVAVVGLGAGTLASYARPAQSWTFYEIDPAVARIASDDGFFRYISDARNRGVELDIVLGDARMRLRDAGAMNYDLIVLDAFSSDAVPVHLLTREAIRLYRSRLNPGGLLAFNLSNRYLDLDPVLGRQAEDAGLVCRVRQDLALTAEMKRDGKQPSIWAVMAATEADLGAIATDPRWQPAPNRPGDRVWTDDQSDLASHLIFNRRRSAHTAIPARNGQKSSER